MKPPNFGSNDTTRGANKLGTTWVRAYEVYTMNFNGIEDLQLLSIRWPQEEERECRLGLSLPLMRRPGDLMDAVSCSNCLVLAFEIVADSFVTLKRKIQWKNFVKQFGIKKRRLNTGFERKFHQNQRSI